MGARVIPLHCIIPPHMLREIARRGDPDQQAWAFRTLSLSEQLRGRRQVLGMFALATPAGAKRRTIYDARRGEELPGVLVRGEGDPTRMSLARSSSSGSSSRRRRGRTG